MGCYSRGLVVGRGYVLGAGLSAPSVMVDCRVAALVDLGRNNLLNTIISSPTVMVNQSIPIQTVLSRVHPLVMVNGTPLTLSVPCCLSRTLNFALTVPPIPLSSVQVPDRGAPSV